MFRCPAGQSGIAARQKLQMVEISATEAKRAAVPIQSDHRAREQFLTAIGALGFFADQKHEKLARFLNRSGRRVHSG